MNLENWTQTLYSQPLDRLMESAFRESLHWPVPLEFLLLPQTKVRSYRQFPVHWCRSYPQWVVCLSFACKCFSFFVSVKMTDSRDILRPRYSRQPLDLIKFDTLLFHMIFKILSVGFRWKHKIEQSIALAEAIGLKIFCISYGFHSLCLFLCCFKPMVMSYLLINRQFLDYQM